jgi:hypothetical protein
VGKNRLLKWLLNRNKKVGYKFSFVVALLALFLLSACDNGSSINPNIVTPVQETKVLVETSATPEPTLMPTETFTPASTATETEIPTNTPASEDDSGSYEIVGEIFQNPQLKEDLENVIVSPSPIDSPEEYTEWKKELNEILLEELPGYQETVVDINNGEGVRVDYQSKIISLPTADWKAVSSYKFEWNGEEVLTKVFPVSVNGGEVLFFHVTYSADDVMFYNTQEEPYMMEAESFLSIFCAPGSERHPFRGEMLKEYTDEQFDSLRRVLAGHAKEGDVAVVLAMEFVLHGIEKE